jgi:8-oxo-dGTP pyrophosphatase MutT (NUDIX family)
MNTHETNCPEHASACVLMIRQGPLVLGVWNERHGCFGLPGGKREKDEPIRQTASRELFEETHLTDAELVWLYTGQYVSMPASDSKPRQVHLYYARRAVGIITPEGESGIAAWFGWRNFLAAAKAFRGFYQEALPDGIGHFKLTGR